METLERKDLSRACSEMLNRNDGINVMLWFSARGLSENANPNVEVARKKIVLIFELPADLIRFFSMLVGAKLGLQPAEGQGKMYNCETPIPIWKPRVILT